MADTNDNDLGFELDGAPNLFEQFHKAKQENADAVVIPGAKPAEPANPDPNKPAATPAADDKAPKEADKAPIDNEAILAMARKHALGEDQGTGDDDGLTDDGKPKPKPVPEGALGLVYEHLTGTLGFEPLSEEEGPFDGSDEKFLEWAEKNISGKAEVVAEEMIAEAFTKNPKNAAMGKDLFRFLSNGGDIETFLDTRLNDDITPEYLAKAVDDDEREIRAEKVMRKYYKSIGWEDAAIDKTITPLKAGGQLTLMAETTLPQFVKLNSSRKAIADQQAETQRVQSQQQVKEYNTTLFKLIDESKEFGAFNLASPKEKQAIKEYMFSPTVEVNGKKVPQYIVDLAQAKANPQFTLHQALSLYKKGIDYTNIAQKASQQATQTLKEKLEQVASAKKIEQPVSNTGNTSNTQRANAREILDFDNIQFA
jgi:hypothetical protein